MKKISFFLIITSILFSGCGQEAKTKEYFEAHPDEAKAKYEECFNTQAGKGRMNSDKIFAIECANAEAVYGKILKEQARADAEMAKLSTNLFTLISDLGAYYTSQGKFAPDLKNMTNITIVPGTGKKGELVANGKKCIAVELKDPIEAQNKPAVLAVKAGSDSTAPICKKILDTKLVKKIMNTKDKYIDASGKEQTLNLGEISVSGVAVKF